MAFKYDIRAMLRKFGVVTVMDVKAYKAKLHMEGTAGYSKGEWDAKETLKDENKLFELTNLE